MPQTNQGIAWPASNVSLGIGISWEAGWGKTDTHGLVAGALSLSNSKGSMLPNGLSGQATTGVPGQSTVYGLDYSIGKNITIGNAGGSGDLGGPTSNTSVTLGVIQFTYGSSGASGMQLSVGLAIGLSFSRYTTYSASGAIWGN